MERIAVDSVNSVHMHKEMMRTCLSSLRYAGSELRLGDRLAWQCINIKMVVGSIARDDASMTALH